MKQAADYREILRNELIERCNRNARYSLRSFARHLKLDPARLSDVLNGKKGLSREAAHGLARILGFNAFETEFFCDSVEACHARSRVARREAQARLREKVGDRQTSQTLSVDAFKAISDWYHFAILQLLKLPKKCDDSAWIGRALELRPLQVEEALLRLERLEMIEKVKGRYQVVADYVFSTDGVPSDALKKFHEQILQKAISAIYIQPISDRNLAAITMPMSRKEIDRARLRIQGFLKSLCDEFSESPDCDSVYCFSTQLFNLTPALTSTLQGEGQK